MTMFSNRKNSSRKLQLESLENRELLSVSGLYNGDGDLMTVRNADDKLSNGVYNAGKDEIVDAAAFRVQADNSASSAKGTLAVVGKTDTTVSFKAYDGNIKHYGYVLAPTEGDYLSNNTGIVWGNNIRAAGGVVTFTGLDASNKYVFFYDNVQNSTSGAATIEHGAKFAGNVVTTALAAFAAFAENGLTATSNTVTFTYTVPVTAAGTNTTISAAFNGASKATNYAFGAEGKLFTYTVKNGKITLSKNAVKGITWETGVDNTVTIKGLASGKTQTIFKIDGATATIRATTTGYGVVAQDSVNFIPTPGAASLTLSFTAAAENRAEAKNAKNTVITTGTKYQVVLQTGKTLKKVTITSTANNTTDGIVTAELTGLQANTAYTLVSIKALADAKTVKKDGANTTSLAAGKTVSISGQSAATLKSVFDKPTLTLLTTGTTASSLTFKTRGAKKGNTAADTFTVVVSWKEGGVAKTATITGHLTEEGTTAKTVTVTDKTSSISATYTVSANNSNDGTVIFKNLKAGITYTVSAAFSNDGGASKSAGKASGTTMNNAAIMNNVTIGGEPVALGTPGSTIAGVTNAGFASLSFAQAQQADFAVRVSEGAKVKYYKQMKDASVPAAGSFTNTWIKQDLATGDILWVQVTSQDGSAVNYYKFAVTVNPVSHDASLYTATISGKSVSFGNPAAAWNNENIGVGKVSLTASQAQSAVLFSAVHSGATVEWAYTANETNPAASFVNGSTALNLTVGGYVWIKVTAEDGKTVRIYKFSVESAVPSNNAKLDGMGIIGEQYDSNLGTPAATWDSENIRAGSVTVSHTGSQSAVLWVKTKTIAAKVEWAFTSESTNPTEWFAERKHDDRWYEDWESMPLALTNGSYVWIKVTAEDSETVLIYKIKVTVAAPSNNAKLDEVCIGDVKVSDLGTPAAEWDSKGIKAGSVTVSSTQAQSAVFWVETNDTVSKVEWAFTSNVAADPTRSFKELKHNKRDWESKPLPLTDGSYVWIKVTAEDKTVLIYKMKVTVAKPSNDAKLGYVYIGNEHVSDLGASAATWSNSVAGKVTLTYTQAQDALFAASTIHPDAKVEWAFTSNGTSNPAGTFINDSETLNLAAGGYVWIKVTAENGTTVNYYKIAVTVVEPSHNAILNYASLGGKNVADLGKPAATWNTVVAGKVSLTYAQAQDAWLRPYTVDPDAKVEWTFTANDTNPTGSFIYCEYGEGDDRTYLTLKDGGYVWIKVTAEDGTTVNYYKIKVTVEAPSKDATLEDAEIYGYDWGWDVAVSLSTPAATWNAATIKDGSVSLTYAQAQSARLGASTTNGYAKVEWAFTTDGNTNPEGLFSSERTPKALKDGGFVWIRVTAEDGETVLIYKIKVTVEAPSKDATLNYAEMGVVEVSDLGTPAETWNAAASGSVSLTSAQAQNGWLDAYTTHSGAAKVEWAFTAGDTDPESSFVVPEEHDGNNWYTYSPKMLTDGGYVWIRVTAEDGETVLIYKIQVTVTG